MILIPLVFLALLFGGYGFTHAFPDFSKKWYAPPFVFVWFALTGISFGLSLMLLLYSLRNL